MTTKFSLLSEERVASIRDIQRNPSKELRGVTRVMRGSQTIGFFLTHEELDRLLEDIEALSSKRYQARIRKGRRDIREERTVALATVAKRYGIRTRAHA